MVEPDTIDQTGAMNRLKSPRSNTPIMNVALWLLAATVLFHVAGPEGGNSAQDPPPTAASADGPPPGAPAKVLASAPPAPPEPQAASEKEAGTEDDAAPDTSDPYHHIIMAASQRYRVDPAIVKAIIMAESSYNPKAVSRRGAMGLMQLMPRTAAEMGVENILDPEHNIHGGVRYYRKLLNRYNGNIELALAAYNAGPQKVKKYQGVPPFKATRYYIRKVIKFYRIYKKEMESDQA